MFTCISCRVAFETAGEQRSHFATDWHRYNMKRRVANLPPVAATAFNEKVLERREQNAVRVDPRDLFCAACSKAFSTENAYRSHVQSKKHRDREAQYEREQVKTSDEGTSSAEPLKPTDSGANSSQRRQVMLEDAESTGSEDEEGEIEERIASSRRRIQPSDCLFCTTRSQSVTENIAHMSRLHSFFIPDQDLLVDPSGLLSYLGEKVVLGNLCLYCPNGGKEFGSVEAVRRHMVDKAHCKLAYDTDEDRVELADYYSFDVEGDDSAWEEVEDEEEDIAMVEEEKSASLAPDGLSLQLPSGRTLGHRSLKVYYSQRLRPFIATPQDDPRSLKIQQVRSKLADPTQALVPIAGGQGAYGRGLQVVKARNAGEAKWVRRQARSFRDQRVKEAMKTKVGFVHNNQKHFRDPLLQ